MRDNILGGKEMIGDTLQRYTEREGEEEMFGKMKEIKGEKEMIGDTLERYT